MRTKCLEEDTSFDPTPAETEQQALRVVIVYNDLAAGKHAMQVMVDVWKELAADIEFKPLPWRFDLLSDEDWHEVAALDAVRSDILIISTSSAHPLPPTVGRWVEDVISRKHGRASAVVALFGPEECPDDGASPRLQAIQSAAQRAGLDFFAPVPRHELDRALDRIHQRAERITPVLEHILHDYEPARRWGINE